MNLYPKLYQRVAEQLADGMSDGHYPLGSRLPSERQLAQELLVSRQTVREAMIALEAAGLVQARHGSGVYVTRLPAESPRLNDLRAGARELIEARLMIEGEAVALAAADIDEPTLSTLRDLLEDMEDRDASRALEADLRFHLTIAEATGNPLIRATVEMLWAARAQVPMCAETFEHARRQGVGPRVREHRQIVDALEAHNPQRARDAMHNHLSRVTNDLLEATQRAAAASVVGDLVAAGNHTVLSGSGQ